MENALLIAAAFALGGLLKGATGFGAPLLAVPLISLLYDVPFAVAVFSIPNLIPNLWQTWTYRKTLLQRDISLPFAIGGALGAGVGSLILAGAPGPALMIAVAFTVFGFVAFRLLKPGWQLSLKTAARISWPVGLSSGTMQGATGISAPISASYLSAMKLNRETFVPTISLYFLAAGIVQIPMLIYFGILDGERLGLSFLALIPLMGAMPVGAWLGNRVPASVFDKIVLGVLTIVGLRLLLDALT